MNPIQLQKFKDQLKKTLENKNQELLFEILNKINIILSIISNTKIDTILKSNNNILEKELPNLNSQIDSFINEENIFIPTVLTDNINSNVKTDTQILQNTTIDDILSKMDDLFKNK